MKALLETWPPASSQIVGPWLINTGEGGGQRVSAARALQRTKDEDVAVAEDEMRGLNQTPIFQIWSDGAEIDSLLAARRYRISDPTILLSASIDQLCSDKVPPVTAFPIWPPLQIMSDIWAAAGIGRERLAIMERAVGRKTAILGRINNRPAATMFVARSEEIAMVHALEVVYDHRRQGLARHMMVAAAQWAAENGARHVALAVTKANAPALSLYRSLGMRPMGEYHYRVASNL